MSGFNIFQHLNWVDCELTCFSLFLQVHSNIFWRINCSWSRNKENLAALTPRILTPFNYLDWRDDIHIVLCKKGLYKVTIGEEIEPQQPLAKSKYLNKLDEAFGFMCIHISRELLFHLDGMKTPKEVWEKLESLFGKKDELRGHIMDNELITPQTRNFKTIQTFFSHK